MIQSKEEYVKLCLAHQKHRNLYLESINNKDLLNIERMKRFHERHNKVFKKVKMRPINKVEHGEYVCLIKVSS